MSENALNLPPYLSGQIDLIMSSFMGLKTGKIANSELVFHRPCSTIPKPSTNMLVALFAFATILSCSCASVEGNNAHLHGIKFGQE